MAPTHLLARRHSARHTLLSCASFPTPTKKPRLCLGEIPQLSHTSIRSSWALHQPTELMGPPPAERVLPPKRNGSGKTMTQSWELWMACRWKARKSGTFPACGPVVSSVTLVTARAGLVSCWNDFQPPHFLSFPSVVFVFLTPEVQHQSSLPNLYTPAHRTAHARARSSCHSWRWAPGDEPQRSSPARSNTILDQGKRQSGVTEVPPGPATVRGACVHSGT